MPTSEQIRSAAQAYVDSFNKQDKTAFLDVLSDTIEHTDPIGAPPRTGKVALAGFWDTLFGSCQGIEFTMDALFVSGDEAALRFHIIQRRSQASDVVIHGVDVIRVDDAGKIVAIRRYSDTDHVKSLSANAVPENASLKGKIGVLAEEHFDETGYVHFNEFFPAHGYQVDYISRLWGNQRLTFKGNDFNEMVTVPLDVDHIEPAHYKGIILIGGYAMDRLRYEENPQPGAPNQAPAVQFLRKAVALMDQGELKIGTICHALWLFCASPDLIQGRKVTCAHNIICDVENAGGIVVFDGNEAVDTHVDGGLISGRHPGVVQEFASTFLAELESPIKV